MVPFISLFMITPVSGTMTPEPKKILIVVVIDNARSDESAVTMCDVPWLANQHVIFSRNKDETYDSWLSKPSGS